MTAADDIAACEYEADGLECYGAKGRQLARLLRAGAEAMRREALMKAALLEVYAMALVIRKLGGSEVTANGLEAVVLPLLNKPTGESDEQ